MANLATRAVELVAADLEARIRAGDATAGEELRYLIAQSLRDPGPYIAPRSRVVGADLFQPATSAVQPMIVNCARVAPFDSDATSLAGT